MYKVLRYLIKLPCYLRAWSCCLRSWLYEVGGALGVSFSVNLMTARCTKQPCQVFSRWLYPWATFVWLIFGALCFVYAYYLRETQKEYKGTKEQGTLNKFLAKRMCDIWPATVCCIGIFLSFFLSFLFLLLGA